MNTRRQFLLQAPVGMLAAAAMNPWLPKEGASGSIAGPGA